MFKFFRFIIIFYFFALTIVGPIFADEIKFEASLDKKAAAIGETAQLGLTFYGTQSVPAPDIGNIDGCDVRYLGPSTMTTIINGAVSSSITHMYRVQPLKLGKFQFGPFTFKYEGNAYKSNAAFLTVSEESPKEQLSAKAEVVRPAAGGKDEESIIDSLELRDKLFLTLKIDKTRAYVNELIPVAIKLYVNRLNVSDIQLPDLGQEGFSKAQFEEPKQYRERMGGELYDVLEFRTTIFGTRPGDYKLGPAKLKCNIAVRKRVRNMSVLNDDFMNEQAGGSPYFDDFFTRYERYPVELKSEEMRLMLSPLPAEGRPIDFSGAIGDYQFIFQAGPKKVKVGDPVTLTMEINGTGNFNTVIIPKLENIEGFRIYEPQAKTEPNRKVFRQVLIPETDLAFQTPKAIFTYFDPNKKEYKTITQGPLSIQVERIAEAPPQVIGGVPAAIPSAPMGIAFVEEKKEAPQGDILYIKESLGRIQSTDYEIYKSPFVLAVIIIPLLALLAVYAVYARRERFIRDTKYAHRAAAFKNMRREFFHLKHCLKANDAKSFYEALFQTLQNYLGGMFYIPVAGLTFDTIEPVLKYKNMDIAVINKIKNIFDVCDRAKFALFNVDELRMKDDMRELEEIIRDLGRKKAIKVKKYILILMFLVVCPGLLFAQNSSNDPHHLFSKGNALYERREYKKAVEEYTKILDSNIESGPLYYDIGNAFFKMGKIGYAILAYKKAQKLITGDRDLKSNLAYAQSLTEDSALQIPAQNSLIWLIRLPFGDFNLNTVASILLASYLTLIILMVFGIMNPVFKPRAAFPFYLALLLFLMTLANFSARYYNEEVLTRGITVVKESECKYEPIDKSTTYYTLKEGQEVLVLTTRNGWRRVKRLDGKLAWVKKEAIEEI